MIHNRHLLERQLHFKSVLWLDDARQPLLLGVKWVKSYDEFVAYLKENPVPELVCFDHDLHDSHYPLHENKPGMDIPYHTYTEKTGLECARYLIDNKLPVTYWSVHSFNAQGRINIENALRAYCPDGEMRGLKLPYRNVG